MISRSLPFDASRIFNGPARRFAEQNAGAGHGAGLISTSHSSSVSPQPNPVMIWIWPHYFRMAFPQLEVQPQM